MAAVDSGLIRPAVRQSMRWWNKAGIWLLYGCVAYALLQYCIVSGEVSFTYELDDAITMSASLVSLLSLSWIVPAYLAARTLDQLRKENALPQYEIPTTERIWLTISAIKVPLIAATLTFIVCSVILGFHRFAEDGLVSAVGVALTDAIVSCSSLLLFGLWQLLLLIFLPTRPWLVWGMLAAGIASPLLKVLPIWGEAGWHCIPETGAQVVVRPFIAVSLLLGMIVFARLRLILPLMVIYPVVLLGLIDPPLGDWLALADGQYLSYKLNLLLMDISKASIEGVPLYQVANNETWGIFRLLPTHSMLRFYLPIAISPILTIGLVLFIATFRRKPKANQDHSPSARSTAD